MVDHTKLQNLCNKVGGRFKLTVLLQKRVKELVNGAPPLVETQSENYIEIAIMEVEQDKIDLQMLTEEEIKAAKEEAGAEETPAKNPLLGGFDKEK